MSYWFNVEFFNCRYVIGYIFFIYKMMDNGIFFYFRIFENCESEFFEIDGFFEIFGFI